MQALLARRTEWIHEVLMRRTWLAWRRRILITGTVTALALALAWSAGLLLNRYRKPQPSVAAITIVAQQQQGKSVVTLVPHQLDRDHVVQVRTTSGATMSDWVVSAVPRGQPGPGHELFRFTLTAIDPDWQDWRVKLLNEVPVRLTLQAADSTFESDEAEVFCEGILSPGQHQFVRVPTTDRSTTPSSGAIR